MNQPPSYLNVADHSGAERSMCPQHVTPCSQPSTGLPLMTAPKGAAPVTSLGRRQAGCRMTAQWCSPPQPGTRPRTTSMAYAVPEAWTVEGVQAKVGASLLTVPRAHEPSDVTDAVRLCAFTHRHLLGETSAFPSTMFWPRPCENWLGDASGFSEQTAGRAVRPGAASCQGSSKP